MDFKNDDVGINVIYSHIQTSKQSSMKLKYSDLCCCSFSPSR